MVPAKAWNNLQPLKSTTAMYASSPRETARISYSLLVGIVVLFPICCHAWIQQCSSNNIVRKLSLYSRQQQLHRQQMSSFRIFNQPGNKVSRLSVAAISDALTNPSSLSEDDDDEDAKDDEEYEYVEYDILTESEFRGSEWLVGTVMDTNSEKIVETWVRLATDKDGKNVAIWGDQSQGTWAFDTANQFLSFSKEQLWGKDIWAGVVDDYYYVQGTVRGWNFFLAAAVLGQWQAKRLGVDPDEAGVAPWFEEVDENNNDDDATKESTVTNHEIADDTADAATSSSEDSTKSKA